MPYVKKYDRDSIDAELDIFLKSTECKDVGDYAYAITKILNKFLHDNTINYHNLALAIGILDTVKLEINRRIIIPYEDSKKNENGDVF